MEKYKEPCPEALVESAMYNVKLLEDNNFLILKLVKSSDIFLTVKSYRKLSEICDYPLHLESQKLRTFYWKHKVINRYWTAFNGRNRYTPRVSLSSDPIDEVKAGYEILKSLGIDQERNIIFVHLVLVKLFQ